MEEKFFFKEMFVDIKKKTWARFYTPMQLTRRFVYVIIVVVCRNWTRDFQFISFLIIQIAYTATFLLLRPFEIIVLNIVEALNEIFFIGFIIIFYSNNSESSWESAKTPTLYLLISNTIVIALIIITENLLSLWKTIKKRKLRTTTLQSLEGRKETNDAIREENNPYLDAVDQQNCKSAKKLTRVMVKEDDYPNLNLQKAL